MLAYKNKHNNIFSFPKAPPSRVIIKKTKGEKMAEKVNSKDLVQRTLVLCKPDAVQRGIVGEIIQRFERVGLKIVGIKMAAPDVDLYEKHYEEIGKLITRRGEQTFRYNLDYMLTGPVIAICLEGIEAVELVRKIVGPTEPKSAPMGTIRGDYSHMSFGYSDAKGIGVPNLVHASGSVEEAKEEVKLWFTEKETYDYEDLNEKYTRGNFKK
jgi:nucleoside-diphosphate kinase